MHGQRTRRAVGDDGLGRQADTRLRLDVGAQLQGAQGIQTVIGERTIGIDRPPQDQADLVGDQTAQPVRPLVRGSPASSASTVGALAAWWPSASRNASANGLRAASAVNNGIPVSGR